MSRIRKTRPIDWAVVIAALLLGLLSLTVGEFARRHGRTPESELTVVRGAASDATTSTFQGVTYLRFTVAGQTVDYSSDMPRFQRVVDAIRSGEPMTVGVSTKRETLFPRSGWVPLYKLSINGEEILTYRRTVAKGYRASNAPFIIAAFLLLLAAWGLVSCYRNRNNDPVNPGEALASMNDPRRVRAAAIIVSSVLYAALMFAMQQEESLETSAKVFGPSPLGLPLRVFVAGFFTLLLLPMPLAAWHGYKLIFRRMSEGGGVSTLRIIQYLLTLPERHSDLRKSRVIVVTVLAFYLALIIGWIIYADSHHIGPEE